MFFILLLCFSMVSCASAAEKTSDDMNDFSHYTIASKIAYTEAWYNFRSKIGLVPGDMDTLNDIAVYFNSDGRQDAVVVCVPVNELKPGDIVHVKNSQYAFMIYRSNNTDLPDSADSIILESQQGQFRCDPDLFNQLFDGYAVKFPKNALERQLANNQHVDGSKINDIPYYDPSIVGGPVFIGNSQYVIYWNQHQFDPDSDNNVPVKDFVDYLLNDNGPPAVSDMNKSQRIFDWVQSHVKYNGSTVGSTKYSLDALTSASGGNSCDQARLVYAMSKFAGLDARFHKANCKFPSGTFAHVWTDIKVDGKWLSADTTSQQNNLGNTVYSSIITDYGTFSMLDC